MTAQLHSAPWLLVRAYRAPALLIVDLRDGLCWELWGPIRRAWEDPEAGDEASTAALIACGLLLSPEAAELPAADRESIAGEGLWCHGHLRVFARSRATRSDSVDPPPPNVN